MLTRTPSRHSLPDGITAVEGDTADPDSVRAALAGVDAQFLLVPVVPDELTRALTALAPAADAGVRRVVYLSMVNADVFADCPHAAVKAAAERAFDRLGLGGIVLRPNYFMQNDAAHKSPLTDGGVYPMPVGRVGVAMVDVRDIAEVAALKLIEPGGSGMETVEVSGPEEFTGDALARMWSEVLGRPVRHAGDDLVAFEAQARSQMPPQMAYDLALMFRGFHHQGMRAGRGAADRLAALLGRPPRTYRAFAEEQKEEWGKSWWRRLT